jgi:hypothetical protein
LFNSNYRRCDVEGYRIYRALGLSGGFELIAQFDKTGTSFTDTYLRARSGFVPEENLACNAASVPLTGDVVFFREGARVRNAVTGAVALLPQGADTIRLSDTGVPFAFVDNGVRNGITYRYIVTAFDVNSLKSGAASLESARVPLFVTPRKDPNNLVFASFSSQLTGATGGALNTSAADPTISSTNGTFSGAAPPTNGISATFSPLVTRLLPAFNLVATIDSIIPYTEDTHPSGHGCPKGSNALGACWQMHMSFNRDGTVTRSVADGWTPAWATLTSASVTASTWSSRWVRLQCRRIRPLLPSSDCPRHSRASRPHWWVRSTRQSSTARWKVKTNRRATTNSTIFPGFGTGARHVAGGSRWFSVCE